MSNPSFNKVFTSGSRLKDITFASLQFGQLEHKIDEKSKKAT